MECNYDVIIVGGGLAVGGAIVFGRLAGPVAAREAQTSVALAA